MLEAYDRDAFNLNFCFIIFFIFTGFLLFILSIVYE